MKQFFKHLLTPWMLLPAASVTLVLGVVSFEWFAHDRPYKKMKSQIASLSPGTKLQNARAQIERGAETSCSTIAECKQILQHRYSGYSPNPIQKVRGPVLVYRMSGVDHIHCLYFDKQQKLILVTESTLAFSGPLFPKRSPTSNITKP